MADDLNEILETKPEKTQAPKSGGFFSFHTLITGSLIKILYILGLFGIIIGAIIMIAQGSNMRYGGEAMVTGGILLLIFGNLFWRLICEGWILLFSMHEIMVSMLAELKRK